ncbi:hypothetical protein GCK32_002212 [Trichostrongylus colubriformis]|uniref:Uncharacterized protein n=1 Tax=Trichostrongylus colubriformis TaxID=6319 RepID=A0AAN8G6R0_TRICO
MLFVILVLCATVSAVPWHYSEASGAGVTGTTGPSTSVIYHRRYPMYGRYQAAWPDARFEGKALSVTVQFKHGNRTVNCMKYR